MLVPGFAAEDVKAEVRGRLLHLHARTATKDGCGERTRVMRRSVMLPEGTSAEAVTVTCANGVLRATVPRAALPQPEVTTVAVSADAPAALSEDATCPTTPKAVEAAGTAA